MKFITLTDANQETRKYTINGKETAEQILKALERQQTIDNLLKSAVR